MSHEVESMMYVGQTPWHGLGKALTTNPASVQEALKEAGLDWTISLAQLQTASGTLVDSYAIVRDSDGQRGRTTDARLDQLWLKDSGPVSRALPAAVDTFLRAAA